MFIKTIALLLLLSSFNSDTRADQAKANLQDKNGSEVTGTVRFTDESDGVRVHYQVQGLDQNSTYGIRLRHQSDCFPLDDHSVLDENMKGDLYADQWPSIQSDSKGTIDKTFILRGMSLKQDQEHSLEILGSTDENGRTVPRVACGVIKPI